jgi:hypothetical protein
VAETNQPLTLGILLDTSGSQQRLLPMEVDAASQFIQQVCAPRMRPFAVNFDVNVDLLQDYTNSPRQLTHAMARHRSTPPAATDRAFPVLGGGTVPTVGDPKGTLLYDAIYLAANDKMNQEPAARPSSS